MATPPFRTVPIPYSPDDSSREKNLGIKKPRTKRGLDVSEIMTHWFCFYALISASAWDNKSRAASNILES